MNAPASGSTWALRLHAACDWILWAMTLNVLWLVFTLAGAVVLGAAPASVAAAHVTRRRLRGESFPVWRAFAGTWRREFRGAHIVVTPALIVATLLLLQSVAAVRRDAFGSPLDVLLVTAAAIATIVTTILVPLYVHYDLPRRAYLPTASRWMLRNLAHALLLAAAATLVVTASAVVPGLIPFVSIGAWLSISTALCVAFFAANDRAVIERRESGSAAGRPHTAADPRPAASPARAL